MTTTTAFPAINTNARETSVIEHVDGSAEFVISPQFSCQYDANDSILWSRWAPTGIPSFNIDLLHDLQRASQMIEGYFTEPAANRPLNYIALRSGAPGVFNLGGDLGHFQRLIAAQNRARLTEYARAAIDVQYRNYIAHNLSGVTTVAPCRRRRTWWRPGVRALLRCRHHGKTCKSRLPRGAIRHVPGHGRNIVFNPPYEPIGRRRDGAYRPAVYGA